MKSRSCLISQFFFIIVNPTICRNSIGQIIFRPTMIRDAGVNFLLWVLAVEAGVSQELGLFRKAQSLRWHMEMAMKSNSTLDKRQWAQKILASDIRLCEIAQKEEHLQAEIRALSKNDKMVELSPTERERQKMLTEQVEELCQEYYRQKIRHAQIEESLPFGPFRWGYTEHRKRAMWHMKTYQLVYRCRNMGGCCARDCGCCSKRSGIKLQHYGHCTLDCHCCRQVRGFGGESEDDRRLFFLDLRPETTDSRTLARMSYHVWGSLLFC